MSTVEELIGDLLLRHNCVIVPSFGGFVAKQSSARIDYKNGIMLPPRKSVLFNRQLINSDGLLVSEFAAVNNVYYTAAEENVRERVADWNEKLRHGERVTLDRVGYLFYDQEKNICFEQDRFFNLLLESYGLGKVHFVSEEDIQVTQHISAPPDALQVAQENVEQPIIQLVPIPISHEVESVQKETPVVVIEHPETRSLSKMWRYVAAAVLLPIGFYSFWIPMKTNVLESGVLSINDFNLGYKATDGYYEKTPFKGIKFEKEERTSLEKEIEGKNVSEYPLAFDDFLNIRVSIPQSIETPMNQSPVVVESPASIVVEKPKVESAPEKKVEVKKTTITAKEGNFSFIVGSYSTEERANEFVAELKAKGLQAFVMPNGTSYRVSSGSASTAAEINSIGEKTKANGIAGWILKK